MRRENFGFINFSNLQVTVLDYHSRDASCEEERLIAQYNGHTTQICGNRVIALKKLTPTSNKVMLQFNTNIKKTESGFWLKFKGIYG